MNDPSNSPTAISVGAAQIPAAEVRLIVAEAGISLSGGEMLIWKRNVVVSPSGRFVSALAPAQNAVDFEQWLAACPNAVGILTNGTVRLPRLAGKSVADPLEILREALTAARRELSRQIKKSFLAAVGCILAGAAAIALFVVEIAQHAPTIHTGVLLLGIALTFAAVLVLIRGFMLIGRRNRILAVVEGIISKGDLNPADLAGFLAPEASAASIAPATPLDPLTGAPAVRPRVSVVAALFSICGVALMICPLVGVISSVVALALTFKSKSWARTLAIVGLVGGIIFTCFAFYMATRPDTSPSARRVIVPQRAP